MVARVRSLVLAAVLVTNTAFVPRGDREVAVPAGPAPRTSRVLEAAAAPAGWRAVHDHDTGVTTRMWGGYIDVPGAMRDPGVAERAARAFLTAHLGQLAPGARLADFVLVTNRIDGAVRTLAFGQRWNGLRVVGGQLHVVFANDRLFLAGSEALPHVQVAVPGAGHASAGRAEAWLRHDTGLAVTARPTGERVVLPLVHGPGNIEYRVADVLDASASTGQWDVYVAPDGAPLLRTSRRSYATGTLRFDVGDRRPTGTRRLAPAGRANLTVDGTAALTADDGGFAWPGTAPAAVDPSVLGSIVQIVNSAGALATVQLVAQPGQPVDWSLADDEQGDAQLTAYVYAMVAKARGRAMQPGLAWLDLPLQVHVNEPGSCNAFSTGDDLHFFRKDAMCENTGRLADVVMHEFGHSFHHQTIIPGVGAFNQPMSEGVADFFAANIVDDPGVGRGFTFDDTPVRELDPAGTEKHFPEDVNGSPHLTGLILAGALWDLRKALIAELGAAQGIAVTEQIYVGVLQRATDLPTTYLAALTADDNDGNLGNGTPHGCAIEAAFGRHGLAAPGFETTTIGVPVVSGTTVAFTVTTPSAGACPRPRVTAMALAWQLGPTSTPTTIPMTLQGTTWSATLPAQPDNTLVLYRAVATFDDGSTANLPDNAADPLYQLLVGDATPIWCEPLNSDPQWTQVGQPEWEVARPSFVLDAPRAFTGDNVLGTNVRTAGSYNAFNATSIETPPIDGSAYQHVHVQFRRWLTIEDGTFDQATIAVDGATVWQNTTTAAGNLDHVDKEWRLVDLEVTPSAAITVGWTLDPDGSRQLGGWNLDDICVVGLGKIPRCGDGFVDVDESCDDGNATAGDGCTPDCVTEPDEGGGCCSSSSALPAWLPAGAVLAWLWPRRRSRRSPTAT
ncbi:MAG: cysteine-rich repeat protein [Deltaproteobacteria bacterium]|nr:cysteine-rich repeat protein [Deltaproteobacteria bacterium]